MREMTQKHLPALLVGILGALAAAGAWHLWQDHRMVHTDDATLAQVVSFLNAKLASGELKAGPGTARTGPEPVASPTPEAK